MSIIIIMIKTAIEGFHVIRKDPQIQRETGLVVYVHETMSVTRLTEFEKYGVECIWLEVKLQKTSPFLVGFLYRNPSEPANWTDKFVSMMDVVWLESKEIILMGDFNIDLSKKPTNRGRTYSLFLTSLRLLALQPGSHLHQKRSLIISTQLTSRTSLKPVCQ